MKKSSITDDQVVSYQYISSGSTLLDLAISGGRIRGGGLPGRTIVEIFGPPSSGKSAIVAEAAGNAQRSGGQSLIADPEARLDTEYCKIYGIHIDPSIYFTPPTVTAVFARLIGPVEKDGRALSKAWTPDPTNVNVYVVDSLAALSTDMEIEKGDAMGQRRAKEFSEGFRLTGIHIKQHNILFLATNQVREAIGSYVKAYDSPGGMALKHYTKIRIQLTGIKNIEETISVRDIEQKRIIGIELTAKVVKNQAGVPLRSVPIYIVFNYGIDDVKANLKWLMDNGGFPLEEGRKRSSYTINDKKFISLDAASKYVEENRLEQEIKGRVIDLWEEIEGQFKPTRVKRRE